MYFTYPGTHCLSAPIPPNNTELIVSGWNGDPFNFDSPATYVCKRGQKYEQNFGPIEDPQSGIPPMHFGTPNTMA